MRQRTITVTRRHLAERVARSNSLQIREAEAWVGSVIDAMRDLLLSADPEIRLEIRDFGVFEVKHTKEKSRARNPRTGEEVYVPPHRKTHFRPGKLMKAFLAKPLGEPPSDPHAKRDGVKPFRAASAVRQGSGAAGR
jgi:integration host factor subunit beta